MALSRRRSGSLAFAREMPTQLWETIHRAFVEFLTIPSLVIGGFVLLAAVIFLIDQASPGAMWGGLFSDRQTTRDFLGVIATSIITVTSITLSLLLIAVQQGAAALTSLVFDQFLRRRTNQLYFGFFIGLALYALIVLASTNESHNPTYGVVVAGLMTVAALYMLIILIYTTIDQMRPVVIIGSIHDHTLIARECQLDLLRNTRQEPKLRHATVASVTAEQSGFFVHLDTAGIVKAAPDAQVEIVILISIGDYVAFGDPIAEVRTTDSFDAETVMPAIRKTIRLEAQRDLDVDPAYGVEQIATIGWTSISTSKSNPGPGLLTIHNLRDLLARWLATDAAFGASAHSDRDSGSIIVYRDNLPDQLLCAFESLAVVASESIQHQSAAEIYRVFAGLFDRLPPALQQRADDLLLRSLSGLGDHMLTSDLDASLQAISGVLKSSGRRNSANAFEVARQRLGQSIGQLNSRSTRTKPY